MKTILRRIKWAVATAALLSLPLFTQAQVLPPPGNHTNWVADTNYQARLEARLATNRASILPYLHEGLTLPDGTPASFQEVMDQQITSFSTSGTFSWHQSALDEAQTWALATGIPLQIERPDGTSAYLVGREGDVPQYIMPFDLAAAVTISTTNLWPGGSTGFSLSGTNSTISMWDEGSPRLTHGEFGSRVTMLDGVTNLSDHSTAVAGMLAASGAYTIVSNGVYFTNGAKGMAYSAQVQARDFTRDVGEMTGALGSNNMRLSNHSYGSVAGWFQDSNGTWYWWGNPEISTNQDPKFGNYTTNAGNYDAIIQNAPTYLSVWAAGNSLSNRPPVLPTNHWEVVGGQFIYTNAYRPPDGDQGGFDTLSQQACAKNVLTVGAVYPLTNGYSGPTNVILAPFSSCGPTDDGRIKPDVVADGVNNLVPISGTDHLYSFWSGTSFAAPSVAGSIDLLASFYKQLHTNASELLASTLKGLVIHTADSTTTNAGPSYRFGWGLMNTRAAATLFSQDATNGIKNHLKEVLLPNAQYIQFPIVSGGTNPLKVTICWTDPVGLPNSITNLDNPAPKLINDLDLRVVSSSGSTNFPWVLTADLTNQTAAARASAATTADNARDNVEQVYLANPAAGTYQVRVTHKSNLQSNLAQWVSILISGNVPQQAPALAVNQFIQTATNAMTLAWPAVVGQRYQVKNVDALVGTNTVGSNNWLNVGLQVSARLTNVAVQLTYSPTQAQRFYRVFTAE